MTGNNDNNKKHNSTAANTTNQGNASNQTNSNDGKRDTAITKNENNPKQQQDDKNNNEVSNDMMIHKKQLQDLQTNLAMACQDVQFELEFNNNNNKERSNADTWKAAAVGGLMSIAQDLVVRAVTKPPKNNKQQNVIQSSTSSTTTAVTTSTIQRNNNNNNNNIWDKAIQAAQTSIQVHQQERSFSANDVRLEYVVGNAKSASKIGLVVHGFMTADEMDVSEQWTEWASILDMVLYRVCWPTGSMEGWKKFLNATILLKREGGKQKNIDELNWVSKVTSNPWHVAQDKTVQVGAVLAKFLERQPESFQNYSSSSSSTTNKNDDNKRGVVLIGHSLGAAIVFQTLLQCSKSVMVDHAIFLGGAFVVPPIESIRKVLRHIRGKYINVYSKHDQVLNVAFRAGNLINTVKNKNNPAVGNIPIVITKQITDQTSRQKMLDLDMTNRIPTNEETVFGHTYVYVLQHIAERIKDILIVVPNDNNNTEDAADKNGETKTTTTASTRTGDSKPSSLPSSAANDIKRHGENANNSSNHRES